MIKKFFIFSFIFSMQVTSCSGNVVQKSSDVSLSVIIPHQTKAYAQQSPGVFLRVDQTPEDKAKLMSLGLGWLISEKKPYTPTTPER